MSVKRVHKPYRHKNDFFWFMALSDALSPFYCVFIYSSIGVLCTYQLFYRTIVSSIAHIVLLGSSALPRLKARGYGSPRLSAEWLSPQTSGQRAFAEHSLPSGCSSSFFAVISSPPAFQIVLRCLDAAYVHSDCDMVYVCMYVCINHVSHYAFHK